MTIKTICLHAVMRDPVSNVPADQVLEERADRLTAEPLGLWRDAQGRLSSLPLGRKPRPKSQTLMALLASRPGGDGGPTWWLIPHSAELTLGGVRPLPLAAIEPGDLLADGPYRWLVTGMWRPEPAPAPEHLAKRHCPVCGDPLDRAQVIQCACGRYYHLEKPEDPEDPLALNCYLTAGPCGLCDRQPSLESFYTPEPHEILMDQPPENTIGQ